MALQSRVQQPSATWNRRPSAARRVSLYGFAGAIGAYLAFALLIAPSEAMRDKEHARHAVEEAYEAATNGGYDRLVANHAAAPNVVDTLRQWNRKDGLIERYSVMAFDPKSNGYPMVGTVRVKRRGIWRTEMTRIDSGPRITKVWCKAVANPAWDDRSPATSPSSPPSSQ